MILFALVGCALKPGDSHQAIRYYDLGTTLSEDSGCRMSMQPGRIRTHPALQGSRMWYRHDSSPFEPVPYAISRWSAPPAELIYQQISPLFELDERESPLKMDLEILRMELQIAADNSAQSIVVIAAKIYGDDKTIATRQFTLSADAIASPSGAADAMSRSVSDWTNTLCIWANDL